MSLWVISVGLTILTPCPVFLRSLPKRVCRNHSNHVIFTKRIEYADFPLLEIALYFTDNTILLPSEY